MEKRISLDKKNSNSSHEEAYCKIFQKSIALRKAATSQHAQTKEHKQKVFAQSQSSKLLNVFCHKPNVSDSVRKTELELAVCISCHTSMFAIDHLGEVIMKNGSGSNVGEINLHRTKCCRLIDFVVAPSLKKELKHDLKEKKYSILLGELTDRSSAKHLYVSIRYFSETKNVIESALLGLIPVVSTTGESLFAELKKCLADFNLKLADCIGFNGDGASNMLGILNSVWSRVKLVSPHCILFKCICHCV